MYNIEEIKENYKKFSDAKIVDIARYQSKGLRKEVLEILKDEIVHRGLDKRLISWVDAETDTLTDLEIHSLINKIENLPCPDCLQKKGKLSGFEINRVVSVIFDTNDTTNWKIICSKCGNREKIKSMMVTLLAGWWSRHGFFLTPYILIKDSINFFFQKKMSDRILIQFIEKNTGLIRLRGTEEKALIGLIRSHNKREIE